MGGKSKPSGTQTVTQTNEPPSWLVPYLQTGAQQAQAQLNTPRSYYPGPTTTGYNPYTLQGMEQQLGRAYAGNPLEAPATAMAQQTLSGQYLANDPTIRGDFMANNPTIQGDYLYGGPGFDRAVQAATRYAVPSIRGKFSLSGRGTSGLQEAAVAEAIADPFARLYSDERQRQDTMTNAERQRQVSMTDAERNRQMGAASLYPAFAAQDYQDIDRISQLGQFVDTKDRENIAAAMEQFGFGQEEPRQRLAEYMAALQGSPSAGTIGTTQTPYYRNALSGALGGGLLGAQAAPLIGSGLASMGFGLGGGVGPSSFLASGFANPAMLPLAAGGALLGGLFG